MLAGPGESTDIVFNYLDSRFGVHRVVKEQPVDRVAFLRRRMRNLGAATVAGQLLFSAAVVPLLRRSSQARLSEIKREFNLDITPAPADRTLFVASANNDDTIELLNALHPKVVVVNGTRILSEKVLRSVRATFVNIHAGITPLYRGTHGAYWALTRNDRAHCGVSVHLVDPGIDTGAVLGQALVSPTARDNFVTYPLLQLGVGLPVLASAVGEILQGRVMTRPSMVTESALWSHPTAWTYLRNRLRGVR